MLDVLKPGRYINREWNSVYKEWGDGVLKVALCFPDIYEIGMSHLGMKILYGILNQEKDMLCERVFAPWSDMEKKMRREKTALFSLESRKKLKEFDIVGFSLQYEMSFVDVLNMLDLGGIPLRAGDRGDKFPLVIAGGPCAFNPEPMSDFIDAFVIGEGEEVILEIANIVKGLNQKARGVRNAALKEIAGISGVYVPSLSSDSARVNIKKRIIKDLDSSYFPVNPVVPYVQVVHDRIGIEIMRGCLYKCKFCQACKIFHPLRIRSVERILEIAEKSIRSTGYEELSLLSLSTGDYPYLEELIGKLEKRFKPAGVKISLPSLRVRSFEGRERGGIVKKASVTFAPEAGSERLRSYLNKNIKNKDIIEKSNQALKSGWKKVKLYFMIGLPGETYDDMDAIIELSSQIKNVKLSISPFMPKPHSEFEKEEMDDLEMLKEKQEYLKARFKDNRAGRKLRIDFHDLAMSRIEAIVSRGDKKVGEVIYRAWQKGARLQAWSEYFDYNLWKECFQDSGIDPASYLKKKKERKILPWSFIEA